MKKVAGRFLLGFAVLFSLLSASGSKVSPLNETMFKIVENGDGTTSIFCNESGQLVCTVHGRKSSAVGVSRPFHKAESTVATRRRESGYYKPVSRRLFEDKRNSISTTEQRYKSYSSDDDDEDDDHFSFSSCSSTDTEDPDDCIDQISFCQSLGLINTCELEGKPTSEQRRTFPLRKVSRTSLQRDDISLVENMKLFDETELCSPLGQYALKLCEKHLNEGDTASLVKKYEKYCQISVLSIHPNTVNLPQLRCRDTLKYPLTFRPNKVLKSYWHHTYSFGWRERTRRYRTLKTGLSERSRKLKKLCRNLKVLICRLSQNDMKCIRTALRNKTNCSFDQKLNHTSAGMIWGCKTSNFYNINSTFRYSSIHQKSIVKLENIQEKLMWIGSKVYVKGTNISVSDEGVSALHIDKPQNMLKMKKVSCVRNNSKITEWVPLQTRYNLLRQALTMKDTNLTPTMKIKSHVSPLKENKDQGDISDHLQSLQPKEILAETDKKLKQIHNCSDTCFRHTIEVENITEEKTLQKRYLESPSKLFHTKKHVNSNCLTLESPDSLKNSVNKDQLNGNCVEQYNLIKNARKPWSFEHQKLSSIGADHIPFQQIYQSSNFTNYSKHKTVENRNSLDNRTVKNSPSPDKDKSKNIIPQWSSWISNVLKILPSHTDNNLPHAFFPGESENETTILPDIPDKDSWEQPKTISSYIFKCYGCGFKATYENSKQSLQNANYHITTYHSVTEPSAFLSHSCIEYDDHSDMIMEAFPSYKCSS